MMSSMPYIPSVGDHVRAEIFFEVDEVLLGQREQVSGRLKVGGVGYYVVGVPLASVEPFDPKDEGLRDSLES